MSAPLLSAPVSECSSVAGLLLEELVKEQQLRYHAYLSSHPARRSGAYPCSASTEDMKGTMLGSLDICTQKPSDGVIYDLDAIRSLCAKCLYISTRSPDGDYVALLSCVFASTQRSRALPSTRVLFDQIAACSRCRVALLACL